MRERRWWRRIPCKIPPSPCLLIPFTASTCTGVRLPHFARCAVHTLRHSKQVRLATLFIQYSIHTS